MTEALSALEQIIKIQSGKKLSNGYSIKCPSHDDKDNSASIDVKGNQLLVHCHAGCAQDQVIGALKEKGLWPKRAASRTEYYYQNLDGKNVHRKIRIEPPEGKKMFTQEHLNGGAEWKAGAYQGELLPYNYNDWKDSDGYIFLVEGEKCADILKSKGLLSTTTGGATSWAPSFARHFAGKSVVIIPDNDSEGKAYATKAFDDIVKVAALCKILDLPDLKEKGDVYDWFRIGHTKAELLGLTKSTIEKSVIPFTLFKNLKPVDSGGSLVSGIIDEDNVSCLYGESNVGKSMIAIDISLHIAEGKNWFGREVKKGAVMYVAAEAGPSIAQRTEAYKIHHNLKDEALPFAAILSTVDLYDKAADTSRIIEAIKLLEKQTGEKCRLVVVDTLAKAIAGANENAAQDMNSFLYNIDRIKAQTQSHVLIVHHAGKDTAKGARGHSSLRAAMDTEIEAFQGGLRIKKQRSMQILPEPIGFALREVEIGVDSKGHKMTSCVVVQREVINNSMRRERTSERALQALECLRELIEKEPRAPQVETKSPIGVKVMSHKRWKELFLQRHLLGVESRTTRDSAFKKAAEELQAQKRVGVDGEFCWLMHHVNERETENDVGS